MGKKNILSRYPARNKDVCYVLVHHWDIRGVRSIYFKHHAVVVHKILYGVGVSFCVYKVNGRLDHVLELPPFVRNHFCEGHIFYSIKEVIGFLTRSEMDCSKMLLSKIRADRISKCVNPILI